MAKKKVDFEIVRKIGLALPGVVESTMYGAPALKIQGKLVACIPTHKSAEAGSLAVRMNFDDRADLLAGAPDVYYITNHYVNYNAVLVRFARISEDELRDLIRMAYKFVTASGTSRSGANTKRASKRPPSA